jgi:hypothetical protein
MSYRLRNLNYKNVDEIIKELAALPSWETDLDLSRNDLSLKTGAELALIFAAIPSSVTTLNLNSNALGNKTAAELSEAFSALGLSVNTLYLNENELDDEKIVEIIKAFTSKRPVLVVGNSPTFYNPIFFNQQPKLQPPIERLNTSNFGLR